MLPRGFLNGAICGGLAGLCLTAGASVIAGLQGEVRPSPTLQVATPENENTASVEDIAVAETTDTPPATEVVVVPEEQAPSAEVVKAAVPDETVAEAPAPLPDAEDTPDASENSTADVAVPDLANDQTAQADLAEPALSDTVAPLAEPAAPVVADIRVTAEEPLGETPRTKVPDASHAEDLPPVAPRAVGPAPVPPRQRMARDTDTDLTGQSLDSPNAGTAEPVIIAAVPKVAATGAEASLPRADLSVPAAPQSQTAAVVTPTPVPAPARVQERTRPQTRRLGASGGSLIDRRNAAALPEEAATTPDVAADPKFANPEGKPLLSVILMERRGARGIPTEMLDKLAEGTFPVSIAVDTAMPEAAERAEALAARGVEVLALVDLPENLTAADTEVALSAALRKVPQAVSIFEGPSTGLQGNRDIAEQVVEIAAAEKLGVIWQDKGLGSADQMARRLGVPSKPIFRDLDAAGQDARVIRRFLDNAAFRAGQQGALVISGRLRPEMVEALLVWQTQSRAERIAPAPVSAVLDQAGGG